MARLLDNLNYREAQKRNSLHFGDLSKSQQKALRHQGYRNIGWENIIRSWSLLNSQNIPDNNNVIDLNVAREIRNYLNQADGDSIIALDLLNQDIQIICNNAKAKLKEM